MSSPPSCFQWLPQVCSPSFDCFRMWSCGALHCDGGESVAPVVAVSNRDVTVFIGRAVVVVVAISEAGCYNWCNDGDSKIGGNERYSRGYSRQCASENFSKGCGECGRSGSEQRAQHYQHIHVLFKGQKVRLVGYVNGVLTGLCCCCVPVVFPVSWFEVCHKICHGIMLRWLGPQFFSKMVNNPFSTMMRAPVRMVAAMCSRSMVRLWGVVTSDTFPLRGTRHIPLYLPEIPSVLAWWLEFFHAGQ